MNPPHQVDGRFVVAALSELLLKAWIDESSTIRIRVSDGSLRALVRSQVKGATELTGFLFCRLLTDHVPRVDLQ